MLLGAKTHFEAENCPFSGVDFCACGVLFPIQFLHKACILSFCSFHLPWLSAVILLS